jgi:hypothetical protein
MQLFVRNILLFCFIAYNTQGILFAEGSIIAKFLLGAALFISTIFLIIFLVQKERSSPFLIFWTVLLFLNILGFLVSGSIRDDLHFLLLKGVLITLLPIYPFYYFARKRLISKNILVFLLLVMLPIYVAKFFLNAKTILLDQFGFDVVNNISYSFVSLIPIVFFIRNRVFSFIAMFILLYFIFLGAKRGAFIVGVIGSLFYIYFQITLLFESKNFRSFVVSIFAVVSLFFTAIHLILSNEFLIERLLSSSENSSGRDTIYSNIINEFMNSGILRILFGHGFAASIKLGGEGLFAHNDWLELLAAFGLLGVLVYTLFFFNGLAVVVNRKWANGEGILMTSVLFMWFATSLFSMGYCSDDGFIRAMLISFLLGNSNVRLKKNLF